MNEHPIDNLMKSTMENLKDMIDVNTVIGDTIITGDGSSIVPISKVSFGFASGGSEFGTASKVLEGNTCTHPFGGGSGAGVTVKPVAFLVLRKDTIRLLPVDQDNTYDRIVDSVPQILDTLKGILNKYSTNSQNNNSTTSQNNDSTNSQNNNSTNCDQSDSSSNNMM